MSRIFQRAYRLITGLVPAHTAGRIDRLRPDFAKSWGGPLNGQVERRRIVREIASAVAFDRVLETGTYRGTSTEFFAAVIDAPINTVEGDPRSFAYAQARLDVYPEIDVVEGDSRAFLLEMAAQHPGDTVFIYLDAHWEQDLPLAEELEIIAAGWDRAVVMIDDFEVPGDDLYRFDDYGPGKCLTESYLPAAVEDWSRFYPTVPGAQETGARRGCCVLSSPAVSLPVRSLRPADR